MFLQAVTSWPTQLEASQPTAHEKTWTEPTTPSFDRDSDDYRKLTRCREQPPQPPEKTTWPRPVEGEPCSHDGHFKFKSPNAVPATVFVPAKVQHAAAGPPWTMAHASRNGAPGHQRTLPMLTPTGSTDNVPHPGRPYHGTRPRTYPNVRSGDAACRARFQLIDMPTRLCGQEQASGACSKLAAKKEETSSGQWSSLVTRDGPPQVTGSPDLPRATVLPPSATTAWSQGTTASQIVSGTAAQRAAACPGAGAQRETRNT